MALADLISRLEREAEARTTELDARATAEAAALRAEAARVAAELRERELRDRRAVRRARFDAELATARREARGARLAAQHDLLARVLARAKALLPEVARSPEYLALVPQHLAEALRYVEGLPVVVRSSLPLPAGVYTQVHDASLPPGVMVSADEGSVSIDNTLPARLARLESRLAVELLSTLSGEGA